MALLNASKIIIITVQLTVQLIFINLLVAQIANAGTNQSSVNLGEIHENAGCPTNSYCTKEAGLQRAKWNNFMAKLADENSPYTDNKVKQLDNFRKEHGIVISFWSKLRSIPVNMPQTVSTTNTKTKTNTNFNNSASNANMLAQLPIWSWESPCSHHQKDKGPLVNGKALDRPIYLTEGLIKDSKNGVLNYYSDSPSNYHPLLIGKEVFLRPILITDQKEVKVYFLPLDDIPKYLEDMKVLVLKESEGVYYFLQVSTDGEWQLLPVTKKTNQKENKLLEVECPSSLITKFKDQYDIQRIYSSAYCVKISDIKTSKVYIMLIPISC